MMNENIRWTSSLLILPDNISGNETIKELEARLSKIKKNLTKITWNVRYRLYRRQINNSNNNNNNNNNNILNTVKDDLEKLYVITEFPESNRQTSTQSVNYYFTGGIIILFILLTILVAPL